MPKLLPKGSIIPVQGRLLVELRGKYKNLDTGEEKFGGSKTRGVVIGIAKDIVKKCDSELGIKVGDMVYFGAFEDTARYGADDKEILIKLEEIGGRSDAD